MEIAFLKPKRRLLNYFYYKDAYFANETNIFFFISSGFCVFDLCRLFRNCMISLEVTKKIELYLIYD